MTEGITNESNTQRLVFLVLLVIAVLATIALDQWSKQISEANYMVYSNPDNSRLYSGKREHLFGFGEYAQVGSQNFLNLNIGYVRNHGAAWGAFSGISDEIRTPFFHVVTVLALFMLGYFFWKTPPEQKFPQIALALVLIGTIGNFIDRLKFGYVIDWIDIRWNLLGMRYNFPNFNIADCAITIGVAMILFDIIVMDRLRQRSRTPNRGSD